MAQEKTGYPGREECIQAMKSIPEDSLPIGQVLVNAFMDGCRRTADAIRIKEQEEK